MTSASVEAIVGRYAPDLDAALRQAVPSSGDSGLYAMLSYHMGWSDLHGRPARLSSGKRLRPTLLLLAAQAAGGDVKPALPAAAAVELLHNFSLIHDDIQDRSPERHHRTAVWSHWGIAQAINAGDAMHALAARAALETRRAGADADTALAVAELLHDCCLRLVEGQYLDLRFERRDDVTPDDYLGMIDGKTAALIATSLEMGALLGGASSDALRSHWRAFGLHLGRAFQIVDDVLGVWADRQETGKPTADDVVKGKRALPYLLACASLGAAEAERLREIYRREERSESDVAAAISLIASAGARQAAGIQATRTFDAALGALDAANPRQPYGDDLRTIARFVVERDR